MTDRVTLLLGDCLDRMAEIADGSVDLVCADLPYGTKEKRAKISAWDIPISLVLLWAHYRRILGPHGAIVLTARQPFTSILVMSNKKWYRDEWIWEKSTGTGFLDAGRKPLKCHESVLVFGPRLPRFNPQMTAARRRMNGTQSRMTASCREGHRVARDNGGWNYPRSVLYFPREAGTVHPTQKPVALVEYLIRTYSNPGDLVLDNAAGSGTTIIAAINTGRRAIGIEKDPAIYAIAERRIADHLASTPLLGVG